MLSPRIASELRVADSAARLYVFLQRGGADSQEGLACLRILKVRAERPLRAAVSGCCTHHIPKLVTSKAKHKIGRTGIYLHLRGARRSSAPDSQQLAQRTLHGNPAYAAADKRCAGMTCWLGSPLLPAGEAQRRGNGIGGVALPRVCWRLCFLDGCPLLAMMHLQAGQSGNSLLDCQLLHWGWHDASVRPCC